jgi:hypothetical protein
MLKSLNIIPNILFKKKYFFVPNFIPPNYLGIMKNMQNSNDKLFNNLGNFFVLISSKLASIYIFLITTLKRKKLKMKKHHTWKRWRKNKDIRKSNAKSK